MTRFGMVALLALFPFLGAVSLAAQEGSPARDDSDATDGSPIVVESPGAAVDAPAAVLADPAFASRAAALETAGVLAQESVTMRDSPWTASLYPGEPLALRVWLFKGVSYWFCAATAERAEALRLDLFDADGQTLTPLALISPRPGPPPVRTGILVKPIRTGPHYVRVSLLGQTPVQFSLLYGYK